MPNMYLIMAFATIALTIFLVSGGTALVKMFLHESIADPNPKITSLSPAAMFFTFLGVIGLLLVRLSGENFLGGEEKLAGRQFNIGMMCVFTAYSCLEVLLVVGLT